MYRRQFTGCLSSFAVGLGAGDRMCSGRSATERLPEDEMAAAGMENYYAVL